MRIMYKGRWAEIKIDSNSGYVEDSFATSGQYLDGDERELTDEELDTVNDIYSGEIQAEYGQDKMESEMDRATDYYKE